MITPPLRTKRLHPLVASALSSTPISLGRRRTASPHEFYRYPARFSPEFVRSAIEVFTEPGDLVLDPFVGGGTTAVEAMLANRRTLVSDLNPLATFVTKAKTTPLTSSQIHTAQNWLDTIVIHAKVNRPAPTEDNWRTQGYLRHLESKSTWRVSKVIRLALAALPTTDKAVERFCRCILLRTAQWALDMGKQIPTVCEFRSALLAHGTGMLKVAADFYPKPPSQHASPVVLDESLPGLSDHPMLQRSTAPNLVLTSPPYPGVYTLYHRWKLLSRLEISAPYWIANCNDNRGLSHYTMSAKSNPNDDIYFEKLHAAYSDLSKIVNHQTVLVQVIGFPRPKIQLPRFLDVMSAAGFAEFHLPSDYVTSNDQRLWRTVPRRRWWTQAHSRKSMTSGTSREAVLFHCIKGA